MPRAHSAKTESTVGQHRMFCKPLTFFQLTNVDRHAILYEVTAVNSYTGGYFDG